MKQTKFTSIHKRAYCPKCSRLCSMHALKNRKIKGVNEIVSLEFSYHFCDKCFKFFEPLDKLRLFGKGSQYTPELKRLALNLLKGHTLKEASERLVKVAGHHVAIATIFDWAMKDIDYVQERTRRRVQRDIRLRCLSRKAMVGESKAGAGPSGAPAGGAAV